MWPDFPDPLKMAKDYVVNSAKQIVKSAIAATVNSMKESARNQLKQLEVVFYAKAELKVSAEAGGTFNYKSVSVHGNYSGKELLGLSSQVDINLVDKQAAQENEAYFYGKSGDIKETHGVGAAFMVGASRDTEITVNNGQIKNEKTITEVTATPLLVPIAGKGSLTNENNQKSFNVGITGGASVGAFLNFSLNTEVGLQLRHKKTEE